MSSAQPPNQPPNQSPAHPRARSPRTALVTGATAGIGVVFAERLAAAGHHLVLVARDEGRLAETAARLRTSRGIEVEVLVADLSEREATDRVAARLADAERPVDLLVNNAGFGLRGRFLDNDVEAEQAMLDVLVTAVMRLSHAALGAMAERGSGRIINVSSIAGELPRGTYGAAKAWVTSFSRWAAAEYAPQGVRVMALLPGFVRTEFHGRMGVGRDAVPARLWLDADVLVDEALADLERGRAVSVPSKRYKAVLAATRVVPASALQRLQTLGRK